MASKLWSPRSSTSDEDIKWSKQGLAELKASIKKLGSKARSRGLDPPRILFIGETGSGKSSFISSIVSALKGHIVYTSTVGEKEGHEVNTSKRFLEHRVFLEEDGQEPLNFILCDSRGIAKKKQQGAAEAEIRRLIDGKLRHGDLIEDERGHTVGHQVDSRDSKPPSCVVFVQKAQRFGEKDPDVVDKLELASHLVRERGIPSCVVLTHIDLLKDNLKDKLHLALTSKKIQERVNTASAETGVNPNRVFVVKNYVKENRTHTRHDILILRALRGILIDVGQKTDDNYGRRSDKGAFTAEDLPLDRRETPVPSDSGYSTEPQHSVQSSNLTFISQREPASGGQMTETQPPTSRQSLRRLQPSRTTLTQPAKLPGEQNMAVRASRLSIESQRSHVHDYHIGGKQIDTIETNHSGSDESEYCFDDEGFESAHPQNLLQESLYRLQNVPYPEGYTEEAKLRGAKPLRRKPVYQLNNSRITSSDDTTGLSQQLQKDFSKEQYYEKLHADLQDWSKAKTGAVWTSDTLHNDLGLPTENFPPESVDVQFLFLAPHQPAFLLTIFDPERILQNQDITDEEESRSLTKQETEYVQIFTMQMGKLLTSALLSHCCCDFILLPCTITFKEFSPAGLDKVIQTQMAISRQYFGGPRTLTQCTYLQLKSAATAVAGVSYVPRFLSQTGDSVSDEEQLLLLDKDWRGAVSLLIEKLTRRMDEQRENQRLVYPQKGELKTAVAVMEAAKRLSYGEETVIVTKDQNIVQCCKLLKKKVQEDTGMDLKLSVIEPYRGFETDIESSTPAYVIVMNHQDVQLRIDTAVVHVVSEAMSVSVV